MQPALYHLPTQEDVRTAAQLISDVTIKTPVKSFSHLAEPINQDLHRTKTENSNLRVQLLLKCENAQRTGSFKFRGAYHFLKKLSDAELKKGVVAYSTGNHAQAVAHAAHLVSQTRNFPIPSYVVVPSNCPPKKVAASSSHGATVLLSGTSPNDRVKLAEQVQHATGAVLVPPADHLNIVLGQATSVQEFLDQATQLGSPLDAIIVPSGGGGLLCGAIAVCKHAGVTVFGAEPKVGGPGLAYGLRTGRRTLKIGEPGSIADGLRSLTGEANWEHIKGGGNVQGVLGVSEGEIREALKMVVQELGGVVEPSAAVPLAAVMFSTGFREWIGRFDRPVSIGIILTGGNVSMEDIFTIISGPSTGQM